MKSIQAQALRILVFAAVVFAAGTLLHPSFAGAGETIFYTAIRPANWDIYLFEEPEKPPRRLTDHPALDYNATFSPDGRYVVFCSERQGNPDLFVLDLLNPGPARPLTEALSMEDAPAVSPDGKSIVFVSTRDGNADIFIMPFRPDGPPAEKEAVNLTRHPGGDFNPAFSPLGDRISFVSDREGDFEIYTLDIGSDGQPGELRRVAHSPGHDMHPKFSPDGKWIVFASERGGLNDEQLLIPIFNPQPYGEIFALRLSDGFRVRLTHNKWEDGVPSWGIMP